VSRRRRAEKRPCPPDPRYNSVELSRFINRVMTRGKKTLAQRVVYSALDTVSQETKHEPMGIFNKALENSRPLLEVKPRRVGGATYQVPIEVNPNRSEALAMRWLINAARARRNMPMTRRLALELMDAARAEGTAVKRKEDLHRMADANRAFVHYRW
jgi:small subunit ribosomal protein S7